MAEQAVVNEELEKLRARRRYKKKVNGPGDVVNVWDVPEFMPGAKPGANPKDRDEFERRSIAVFREQSAENRQRELEHDLKTQAELGSKLADDIFELQVMFPRLDLLLIQEAYLLHEGDRTLCIDELLTLSESITGRVARPVKEFSDTEFPALSRASSHPRQQRY